MSEDNAFKIYNYFYSTIRWIEMDVPNKNYIVTKILYQEFMQLYTDNVTSTTRYRFKFDSITINRSKVQSPACLLFRLANFNII